MTTLVRFIYPQLELLGLILVAVGQALFEVNAIQFSLDQLQTYSTENHRSFIYWYYWTMELGHFLYGLTVCGGRAHKDSETSNDIAGAVFSAVQVARSSYQWVYTFCVGGKSFITIKPGLTLSIRYSK